MPQLPSLRPAPLLIGAPGAIRDREGGNGDRPRDLIDGRRLVLGLAATAIES